MADEVGKTEIPPAPPAKPYRRVIEIGDGAQPEVFESDEPLEFTPEQEKFIDKLVDAKRHSSRKIREMGAELRGLRAEGEKNNDIRAFTDEKKHEADFEHTPSGEKNSKLMRMRLAELGIPATKANLHMVYDDLKGSGLLTLKGKEATEETERIARPKVEAEPERIAQPKAEATPQRRKVTSIGTHNRTQVQPASAGPSEYEAYKMPLEDLKHLANRQLSERTN